MDWINTLFATTVWVDVLVLIILNAVSNTFNTLRTLFISKKYIKPAYFVTFCDAIIYSIIIKNIATAEGIWMIVGFAVGKLLGMFIANRIDDKLALGITDLNININHQDKAFLISEELQSFGYTVNIYELLVSPTHIRYKLEIIVQKKELPIVWKVLKKNGYDNPTFSLHELDKVAGKINPSAH